MQFVFPHQGASGDHRLVRAMRDRTGNLPPMPGIFPDEHELFGFLSTDANADVRPIHPKAMPVILTTEAEIEQWVTAPADEALTLQRPLPDGTLKVVMTGEKEDGLAA